MNATEYQKLAFRTAPSEAVLDGLNHVALGLLTESGEYASEVKRMVAYSKPMTDEMKAHMIEELGDAAWYIALACTHLECDLSDVLRENIEKLQKRFPHKFSAADAEARADKNGADHRNS